MTKAKERYLLKRTLQLEKIREIQVRNSARTGHKLKVDRFSDLVAILEYEFGEGDSGQRGGGGLESHAKLRNKLLYRTADNKTWLKGAREALVALAVKNLRITFFMFNYNENFRKGTFQVRRHHKGSGINACVSLHKAPDAAPLKHIVNNIHWTVFCSFVILDSLLHEIKCC